jgi:hypothetical protein
MSDILDLIHDCQFDVEDFLFDPTKSVLKIKFAREDTDRLRVLNKKWLFKRIEVPTVECFLEFHHVMTYTVKDTVHIGTHIFTDLEYDPIQKRITIVTSAPTDIIITVERFEISVVITDTVIKKKIKTSIF